MKSRPIIFDGESVRAILAGAKTQTRRIVKPQPLILPVISRGGIWYPSQEHKRALHYASEHQLRGGLAADFCPYKDGDTLWVRETFCSRFVDPPGPNGYYDGWWYAATDETPMAVDGDGGCKFRKNGEEASPWVSPMFMPREASRITLRVTDVRVERVQEIGEADAIAEGCKPVVWSDPPWWQGYREFDGDLLHQQVRGEQPPDWMIEPHKMKPNTRLDTSARLMFAGRWDFINAKRGFSWDSNPWVWVVTFERIRP